MGTERTEKSIVLLPALAQKSLRQTASQIILGNLKTVSNAYSIENFQNMFCLICLSNNQKNQ